MIETTKQTVTPDQASKWLERHYKRLGEGFKQRGMKKSRIMSYSESMKAGRFKLTPDPIVFDEDHNLVNGQHRLEAVRLANVPVEMMVSTGWPPQRNGQLGTIDTIDRGAMRSVPEQLKLHGRDYAALYTAIVNSMVRIANNGSSVPLSYDFVAAFLNDYEIERHVGGLVDIGSTRRTVMAPMLAGLLFYKTTPGKNASASEFCQKFVDLKMDKFTGPWLLSKYIQNMVGMRNTSYLVRATCAAIRIWEDGETQTLLRPSVTDCQWMAKLNPKLSAVLPKRVWDPRWEKADRKAKAAAKTAEKDAKGSK